MSVRAETEAPGLKLDETTIAPSRSYVRYALGLLLVVNVLNFVDRQVLSILIEPIRLELQLADWQLGLLTGLAFAALYTALGVPIARLAERADRPAIITASIVTWSAATMACGAAHNFWQLALARMGVGIGEAGCAPAAHALIADTVPRERRASALSVYAMGTPLGSVVGLVFGGLVVDTWDWRFAFLVCGLPGLVIGALAAMTLREPRRRLSAELRRREQTPQDFRIGFAELRSKRTFWLLALAVAATGMVGYGGGAFLPSFFLRNHGEELARLGAGFGLGAMGFFGVTLGLLAGLAGLVGTWLGGHLADRLGRRDKRAYASIPTVAAVLAFPVYVTAVLVKPVLVALALMGLANLLITIWSGPVFAAVQSLVRPQMRATAAAVLLLVVNLIGLGLGPLLVGGLSDLYSTRLGLGPAEGLRWAQVSLLGPGLASMLLFWAARSTIRAELVD